MAAAEVDGAASAAEILHSLRGVIQVDRSAVDDEVGGRSTQLSARIDGRGAGVVGKTGSIGVDTSEGQGAGAEIAHAAERADSGVRQIAGPRQNHESS